MGNSGGSKCRGPAVPATSAALALSYFFGAVIKHPVRIPTSLMTPRELWSCTDAALTDLLKLTELDSKRLASFRRAFSVAGIGEELSRQGIGFVALGQEGYPESLAAIYDPPTGLFIYGGTGDRANSKQAVSSGQALASSTGDAGPAAHLQELMSAHRIAIVGARAASRYGLDAAGRLAESLSHRSVCIISGLALGVDAAAHRGAVCGEGGTVAVLGGGVDQIYPRRNYSLYQSLLKSGVIVSEYPPGTTPLPWRFPARNRIIAGLAEGVVVVEAKEKSGALITADFCLEQGKEVFAVPGSIFSGLSAGPNALIKMGAVPVTSAGDILESLGIEDEGAACESDSPAASGLSGDEKLVYQALEAEFRHQDKVAARAGLDSRAAAAALVSLEIKGLARHDPGRGFSR